MLLGLPVGVGPPEGVPGGGRGGKGLFSWETDRERRLTAVITLC